jgi:hypothetical protein
VAIKLADDVVITSKPKKDSANSPFITYVNLTSWVDMLAILIEHAKKKG